MYAGPVDILTYLLKAPLARGVVDPSRSPFTSFIEQSLASGLQADRIAYAFTGAYAGAIGQLLAGQAPARPFPVRMCMAATEKAGNHPRAIETRLEGGTLNGVKTFATLASRAEEMLVVASRGADEKGQNQLVLVRVMPNALGVTITDKPTMAFAPEIPHAIVKLENVAIPQSDILPGDGYSNYLKPFRTIEDTHVLAATVGYAIGAVRANGFEPALLTSLLANAALLVDLSKRAPNDPVTHLLLDGAYANVRTGTTALSAAFSAQESEERTRWERDQPMLGVAGAIRAQRTAAAFKTLTA